MGSGQLHLLRYRQARKRLHLMIEDTVLMAARCKERHGFLRSQQHQSCQLVKLNQPARSHYKEVGFHQQQQLDMTNQCQVRRSRRKVTGRQRCRRQVRRASRLRQRWCNSLMALWVRCLQQRQRVHMYRSTCIQHTIRTHHRRSKRSWIIGS